MNPLFSTIACFSIADPLPACSLGPSPPLRWPEYYRRAIEVASGKFGTIRSSHFSRTRWESLAEPLGHQIEIPSDKSWTFSFVVPRALGLLLPQFSLCGAE